MCEILHFDFQEEKEEKNPAEEESESLTIAASSTLPFRKTALGEQTEITPQKRRRGLLLIVVFIVCLAAFAGLWWGKKFIGGKESSKQQTLLAERDAAATFSPLAPSASTLDAQPPLQKRKNKETSSSSFPYRI